MGKQDDADDTVRLTRPPIPGKPRAVLPWIAGLVVLVAVSVSVGATWYAMREPAPVVPLAVAPAPAPPAFAVSTADEATISAGRPGGLAIYRFAANPNVLVLDFPNLRDQGAALNRVAALVEKAGLPRDRVLTDTELDAAIRARGDTPETFYYGHDYRAADLARFFALADRDHVTLSSGEEMLRGLLRQEGFFQPGSAGALISIPRVGTASFLDAAARATILHHELSHGEYFSVPAYAAYALHFWQAGLTSAERDAFRRFLIREDYDPAQEDLMVNETQAYLMHTPDARFFNADQVGMTPLQISRLRAEFLLGMPAGWLRDATHVASPPPSPAQTAPRQRAAVSRVRAWPTTRSPRRRACSIAA